MNISSNPARMNSPPLRARRNQLLKSIVLNIKMAYIIIPTKLLASTNAEVLVNGVKAPKAYSESELLTEIGY
jgi:hypothetical protein